MIIIIKTIGTKKWAVDTKTETVDTIAMKTETVGAKMKAEEADTDAMKAETGGTKEAVGAKTETVDTIAMKTETVGTKRKTLDPLIVEVECEDDCRATSDPDGGDAKSNGGEDGNGRAGWRSTKKSFSIWGEPKVQKQIKKKPLLPRPYHMVTPCGAPMSFEPLKNCKGKQSSSGVGSH